MSSSVESGRGRASYTATEEKYLAAQETPEFQELRRRYRGWVLPVAGASLVWYFLYVLLGCEAVGSANRARFCYQPFNELLIKAKRTPDVAKRTDFYEQAQVVFKEQAPWLTVAHSVVYEPIRKEVKNYKIDPFGGHIFYGVDID